MNDIAEPDGIVLTFLVFGAYPRISRFNAPAAIIQARAIAVKRAIKDVRKCHAARKVAEALRMRNEPRTSYLADFPINSKVFV